MVWLADLAPCTYVHDEAALLKSVGWLEPEHPYEKGPVDSALLARLEDLRRSPWEPSHFMGFHACGFCNFGEA